MNPDRRLRHASADVRRAVAGREGPPVTFMVRYGNRIGLGFAATAAIAITVAVGIAAVDGSGDQSTLAVVGQSSGTSTTEEPTTTTLVEPSPTSEGVGSTAAPVLAVNVSSAVAPFDHESNVDSMLLGHVVSNFGSDGWQYLSDCMTEQGFDPPELVQFPSRDDPFHISVPRFPPIDTFAIDGFPVLPAIHSPPADSSGPEYEEAARACTETTEKHFRGTDNARAWELYNTVRSAWEDVLTDIDASDEVRPLAVEFGSCLEDSGIPHEYTVPNHPSRAYVEGTLGAYLGYVDSLLGTNARPGDEPVTSVERAEIHEEYGMLYAECGRELFETREQLRSGERRDAFLAEHADAIRELSDLVQGAE